MQQLKQAQYEEKADSDASLKGYIKGYTYSLFAKHPALHRYNTIFAELAHTISHSVRDKNLIDITQQRKNFDEPCDLALPFLQTIFS